MIKYEDGNDLVQVKTMIQLYCQCKFVDIRDNGDHKQVYVPILVLLTSRIMTKYIAIEENIRC